MTRPISTLHKRISKLEMRAAAYVQMDEQGTLSDEEVRRRLDKLLKQSRTALGYEPMDRVRLLTLEERLALARRDARPRPERWVEAWDPQLACLRSQLVPYDRRPMRCARELEVQILERDGQIDAAMADELRANIDAYSHAKDGESVNVLPLPWPVFIEDEDAVADAALQKCPLRESLPLERQLELRQEDYQREVAERRERAKTGDWLLSGLGDLCDKLHVDAIANLEQRIRERDQQPSSRGELTTKR
jgi:hypothetical protein